MDEKTVSATSAGQTSVSVVSVTWLAIPIISDYSETRYSEKKLGRAAATVDTSGQRIFQSSGPSISSRRRSRCSIRIKSDIVRRDASNCKRSKGSSRPSSMRRPLIQ